MFTIFEKGKNRFPIKVWMKGIEELDKETIKQATNLSNLPFVFSHIALMPDCHSGFGMPIGGILATKDAIIPNAVGVDIGCGVAFVGTDVSTKLLKTGKGPGIVKKMIRDIMAVVPVGFKHHPKPQASSVLDSMRKLPFMHVQGLPDFTEGYYQMGTLGGGNHFIELQEAENGLLGIMIHSGSRNFGFKVANFFNQKAKELNSRMAESVPPEYDLAFLPIHDHLGQFYIQWMNLSLDFARENREQIMKRVKDVVFDYLVKHFDHKDINIRLEVNAHHNYAALEEHFGEKVWVHRKGAIRTQKGELGIMPGAMGSYSYIVEGLGNPDAFMSCAHGAGRIMGRKEALRQFTPDEVEQDLIKQGVIAFGRECEKNVPEEYRRAYKNINEVLDHSAQLVKPIQRLKTLAVIKG